MPKWFSVNLNNFRDWSPSYYSSEVNKQEWTIRASKRAKVQYLKYYYPGRIMFMRRPWQTPNITNNEETKLKKASTRSNILGRMMFRKLQDHNRWKPFDFDFF